MTFVFRMITFIEVSHYPIIFCYQKKKPETTQLLCIILVIRLFFLNRKFNTYTTKMNILSFAEDYFNYIWLHFYSYYNDLINNLNKDTFYRFKKNFLLLSRYQFKTWSETHSNYVIINVLFCRQHSWNWNPEKWIQPQAARVILTSCCNRRQQLPCPEQHEHNDYSCL